MSLACCCEACGFPCPQWHLMRVGDAVVSWACCEHLDEVAHGLQRDGEATRLTITRNTEERRQ